MERQNWDDFFMTAAFMWATRSTCIRRSVGAVATKDKRIIAAGYNGVPSGHPHCTPETCVRTVQKIPSGTQLDICNAVHAEQNIIIQAAMFGISLVGTDIYITTMPCHTCFKLLCNLGVRNIYYCGNYDYSQIEETLAAERNKYVNKLNLNVMDVPKEAEMFLSGLRAFTTSKQTPSGVSTCQK